MPVPVDAVELYDPSADVFSVAAPMGTPRASHSAFLLPNGKVLVVGGTDELAALTSTELYDPETDTWSASQPMSTVRQRGTVTQLSSGSRRPIENTSCVVHGEQLPEQMNAIGSDSRIVPKEPQ